jgi:2-hydroxychromene-2-carboxylate isomerase
MTTLAIDFFISMRSPYSYLMTPRLAELTETYDVEINARPVYAIAARDPEWFKQISPMWLPYFVMDTQRTADFLWVPFARPSQVSISKNWMLRLPSNRITSKPSSAPTRTHKRQLATGARH